MKDPVVLEFLGLPDRPQWRERDLEQAVIDHLQEFMLELGKGFCFLARQQRITLDGDHFFVDLVLYIGIALCSRKNDAVARMTLPEGQTRILTAHYEVLLPSAKDLEAVVQEGRRVAERREFDVNRPRARGACER